MISKSRFPRALLFPLFVLCGCTSVQFAPSRVNQAYPARTAPAAVELYRSSTPTKKYFEVGAVNACCSSDTNSMIDLLRQKASANGGDGLMGLDITAKGSVSATVIRYE